MRKNSMERTAFLQYFSLVLPGLIIFTIGLIIPMILGFRYSFTSWNGMTPEKPFVGLTNYTKFFTDGYVRQAWSFTIKFTLLNTIIQNSLALLFAVALDGAIKKKEI